MQRNPHRYQIATGYRTFYSLSLIYQPITKKRLFLDIKMLIHVQNRKYLLFRILFLFFEQFFREPVSCFDRLVNNLLFL